MARIVVNHKDLRTIAQAIQDYCSQQDSCMAQADDAVQTMLLQGWQGADALSFSEKWSGVQSKDSTAVRFRNNLLQFAQAIEASAEQYQKAQEAVYAQARRLPQYLYW